MVVIPTTNKKKRGKPGGKNKYVARYDRQSKRQFPKYKKYMASPQWREKRFERMELDDFRCRVCGSQGPLTVHHITYNHFGNEDMRDLITLCPECHERIHEIIKGGEGNEIRKALLALAREGWNGK